MLVIKDYRRYKIKDKRLQVEELKTRAGEQMGENERLRKEVISILKVA